MNRRKRKQEIGSVEVEATFIFPIMFLCIFFLLYLSLIMYQRANLQATLETALMYYKNTLTDTFVTRNGEMEYQYAENSCIGTGSDYVVSGPKNPYRWVDKKDKSAENFETYFKSVAKNLIFDEDMTLYFDYTNYVVLKEIKVTVDQVIKLPIDFSMIGLDNKYVISATVRMTAVDHEDTIRNIDYIIDVVEDIKIGDQTIGEFFSDISGKVEEYYGKFKDVLGIAGEESEDNE